MNASANAAIMREILLDKLRVSPANVRRTDAEAGIEELAASIAAHGLLQSLVVTPERDADGVETGRYLVVAGASAAGRRCASWPSRNALKPA